MSYQSKGLTLWPLLPNWKRGVTESLEFRTRIIGPTLTGMRQKRRMRIAPRRTFAFEVHPHHDSRRLLDNLRFAQGKNEWALPVWHDRQSLTAALPIGSLVIPCETVGYDFVAGGYAVLRRNKVFTTDFEIVQIDSVEADSLVLTDETEIAWGVDTFLYPIRRACLSDNSNNAVLLSGEVSTLSVAFEVLEPCDWSEHTFASQYRGRPVWEFKNDWRTQRSFSMNRIISSVDNDTSIPSYFDFPGKTFAGIDTLWRAKGRAEHSLVRSALYALAGRYKSLWVPTLANDLQMVGNLGASSVSLDVGYCGYAEFNLGREGRRDIRIELWSGAVYYRRITAAADNGQTERLTLSSSLGVSLSASQVRRISFLMLMQQSSDSVTMTHHTDANGLSTLPLVFEGVVEPPSE